MSDKLRIFIADNHPISLEGLRGILDTPQIAVVGHAATIDDAISRINRAYPDLVVLNVSTGGIRTKAIKDGLTCITKLLTMSWEITPDIVLAAFQNGAGGFLPMTISQEELRRAVVRVTAGENVVSAEIAAILADGIRKAVDTDHGPDAALLSKRERQVLERAAEGLTMKEIGSALFISDRTVQSHLGHAYAKLEVKDRASAIVKAMKLGLLTNV
jgi:DNA-binding NarL/FixJ family response regulator